MKKMGLILLGVVLGLIGTVNAAVDWDIVSGSESISNGDIFNIVTVQNQANLTIWGGDVSSLGVRDNSIVNIYGGNIDTIGFSGSSTTNIYGINHNYAISIIGDAIINVYGFGLEFSQNRYVTGYWDKSHTEPLNLYFRSYPGQTLAANVNLVPEPSALILALGMVGLKLKRRC